MKILIFSTSENTAFHLEKLGILGVLSEYKDYNKELYELDIENIEELFNLVDTLGEEVIIRRRSDFHNNMVIEIYDDYRER